MLIMLILQEFSDFKTLKIHAGTHNKKTKQVSKF